MKLNEFSKTVNKLCGVPVKITLDAEQKVNGMLGAGQKKSAAAGEEQLVDIRWEGTLDGLLDTVASSLGLSWKYTDGEVNLYYLESRTFNVFAIPSQTDMRSIVQSGIDAGIGGSQEGSTASSESNGKGQSSQTTSVSLQSDMVNDIQKSVETMLTQGVGRLSASPSTGKLTVTDTPEVLARVQRYIDSENSSITKQVLLNVKVLSVTLDDSNQFGIDWNMIYSGSRFGASMLGAMTSSGATAASGSNSVSASILDGNFVNSSSLINALAQQGKVSVVTSPSVTTLNLQPVPVQVATQTSYLARVESSTTANVGTSMTLTPGTVTSGFNMNLLPFVMPDNQMLLQYSINLSELKSLKEVKSSDSDDGNKIQVPEIENRIFSQKVKLRSGQTLVLSGFEQNSSNASRSGFGSVFNWLMGGGVSTSDKRNIIVIMISPAVME
ncbi:PilN family type IVB pilus formation outer membrane protein [Enterobacteriaceae bacterium H20N1]|uniref:PilN family type IVB pilus formation outer membrane protein n=1 Tax=Dryocola boscaweniae TaxID=2925397 RepID=A0A9X3AP43_9ENTR|nr:PilN family type IVB pilus formation outer membrane protein [Dryocola boscaweniae]MCT4700535.1 PilN family type IVB pilus formation outer membrane protein [Dryocola boscaweniae]MCT4717691.1 PilN family type IVB pilus formation outer membrane protein [Dryocola boscaweniae]